MASNLISLDQFVAWANGKTVAKYNDGGYPGECVSLINSYCYQVLSIPAGSWGNAYQWATSSEAAKYFDHVATKQKGDVLVYSKAGYPPYGHIEIFLGSGWSLGQNRNYDRITHKFGTLNDHIAILRPKSGIIDDMTDKEAHDLGVFAYRTGLHREPENSARAISMGRRFEDKNGNLTPASVTKALEAIKNEQEWKNQDAKLKAVASDYEEVAGPLYRKK